MTNIICYRCAPSIARWSSRSSPILLTSTPTPSQLIKTWSRSESGTSTSASTTSTNTTTSAPIISQESALNGPISTRPAPLILPTRDPDEKTIRYIFRRAKTYLRFYKTGLVNVWHNHRRAEEVRNRIARQASNSISQAINTNLLTRSDFLLLHRAHHDLTRLPLFGLVFIIFGEFTPLIVPFVTPLVPLTCRLPSQIQSTIAKLEERRNHSFRVSLTTAPPSSPSDSDAAKVKLDDLKADQIRHISASLGLHSRFWPTFFQPPSWLLKRRVRQRMVYLHLDDSLLIKDGGLDRLRELDPEELQWALVDRGLDTLGRNDEQRREVLRGWLGLVRRVGRQQQQKSTTAGEDAKQGLYCRLFLTRPSVWLDRK